MTEARAVEPLAAPPDAIVAVPGSKSLTNRALVAAALARGASVLDGVLFADDTEAMLDSLQRLDTVIDIEREARRLTVHGLDGRLPDVPARLDARMSGTTARFLAPVLALGAGPYVLDGAPALRARPMAGSLECVRALGATVLEEGQPGHLPVVISGGHRAPPAPLRVAGDVSSQFLSGLLLTGPCLTDGLTVEVTTELVSRPYVDMTLATMAAFGAAAGWASPDRLRVEPTGYRAGPWSIEPDASAASYFFAAAALTGGRVQVAGLTADALQGDVRFVDVLEQMGAQVDRRPDGIVVTGTGELHGITVDLADLSDTAQTLAAVAVFADGPTEVTGIGFIRQKETDRIGAVVAELRRCGIDAEETPDGFVVRPGTPRPADVETYDDHRMAMSFALLGLVAPGIRIVDPGCVAKTFPDYWDVLDRLRVPGARPDG